MGIQQNYTNPFYNNYPIYGNGGTNAFAQQQPQPDAVELNVGEDVGRLNQTQQQQQPVGVMSSIGFISTENPQAVLDVMQLGGIPQNTVFQNEMGQNMTLDQFAMLLQQMEEEKIKRENIQFTQKLMADTFKTTTQNADMGSYDAQYLAELNEEINGQK